MSDELHNLAQQTFTLAQAGITYSRNEYDLERYEELKQIAQKLFSIANEEPIGLVEKILFPEHGYVTPKVDVRGIIIRGNKILLVKEKSDGKWCPPGGWADWGYTPAQVVEKEVREEAGMIVKAAKLLAVFDKCKHPHPRDIFYIYKMFFQCEILSDTMTSGTETLDVAFFALDELPELSLGRITREQIVTMFDFHNNPDKAAVFD
ncbi:MAG: NUDIX hydrolase N-terminal domain-containing protein [Ignavibacteriales bacterium]|nr:NUDIX hydrolase N-terminal domain-containing protein [Ignavibacteriales bacterium]